MLHRFRRSDQLARLRDRALLRTRGDDGFILLEAMIAISLITVIMAAVGVQFLTGLSVTSNQRAVAGGVQLTDTTVQSLRALHASDLLKGRDSASVTTEYNTLVAIPAVKPWLNSNSSMRAYDPTVSSGGATAAVPTTAVTQKSGSITYQVYEYLECQAPSVSGACPSTATAANNIRAIVAAVWSQQTCPANTCSYVTSTLINADSDPTFIQNQALPPAPLIGLSVQAQVQVVAVNDVFSLQLQAQNGTGVAPFTWAITSGSLPNGLSLSPAGLISGTVQGPSGTATTTITLTDGFLRQTSVVIVWTILPPLVLTSVPNQANTTADSVNLTLGATGGTGIGYTYSDPANTLPPGLTLSSGGVITGTPTAPAPKTYTVQLTVTDSTGTRSSTTSFTWTITYPPLAVSNPGPQSSTIGTSDTLAMSASGGDGNYSWSASGLPSGMTINATTGLISGAPKAVQSAATVTVTASDPTASIPAQQTTFTWTVYAGPTITSPGAQQNTQGATVSVPVSATCPDGGCTFSMNGQPNGLVINSSTGAISGTVAANATTSTVTVTVTDSAGAQASTSVVWTIYAAPTLSGLSARTVAEYAVVSAPITYTCPKTSCTIKLSGSVPGVGLETAASKAGNNTADTSLTVTGTSGTVYLTGTVQNTAVTGLAVTSKAYSVKITITDGNGVTPTASSATWTATTGPVVTGLTSASYSLGQSVSQTLGLVCQTAPCTISVGGQPSGVTLSSSSVPLATTSGSVTLSGRPTTRGTYTVTVNVTDLSGLSASISATWTVS